MVALNFLRLIQVETNGDIIGAVVKWNCSDGSRLTRDRRIYKSDDRRHFETEFEPRRTGPYVMVVVTVVVVIRVWQSLYYFDLGKATITSAV